jgi:hypothetical protein
MHAVVVRAVAGHAFMDGSTSATSWGRRESVMGKVEDKRAAIVAAQAAREAAEKEQRRLTDPPRAPRKPKGTWQGGRPRGRPPKPAE